MFLIRYIVLVLCMMNVWGLFTFNTSIVPLKHSLSVSRFSKWKIYFGEVNSVNSYVQINDTGFVLHKLECLFIDENNDGYANIDTSSVLKADSLIPVKLAQVEELKKSNAIFRRIKKIPIDSTSFYIRLLEPTSGTNLYLLKKNKLQYYTLHEFAVMKKDTIPVIWTGNDSRTTKTRTFKVYASNK